MVSEISGGLVVRDKNLLMVNSDSGGWNVPSGPRESGELSADTAERVVEQFTGCESRVNRYRSRLKTSVMVDGDKCVWQPYTVEIEGEPEEGEWVPLSELSSMELSVPLKKVLEDLIDRL